MQEESVREEDEEKRDKGKVGEESRGRGVEDRIEGHEKR